MHVHRETFERTAWYLIGPRGVSYWRFLIGVTIQMTFTTLITLANQKEWIHAKMSPELIPVLGTIVALALGFKVASSSADWSEARCIWSRISASSRSLGCLFWNHVRCPKEEQTQSKLDELVTRKINLLRFLDLFAIGIKCAFGGELDPAHQKDYDDLFKILEVGHGLLVRQIPPSSRSEGFRTKLSQLLGLSAIVHNRVVDFTASRSILFTLSQCMADMIDDRQVDYVIQSRIFTQLANLEQGMADMSRLSNGPLPPIYRFQLQVAVWTFLFLLPFQVIDELGWYTVPVMFLAVVTYEGFLEVGLQIEDPFVQFDDLHVQEMTETLRKDLHHICKTSSEPLVQTIGLRVDLSPRRARTSLPVTPITPMSGRNFPRAGTWV
ncbi:hypothetical protein M231_01253 [Tremella mesenterica]|uniref:Uncharacterized protein n=1 Tax=Tremella mesenterica TaxID=5217 RepID=A0A4Q1BTM3_TREME|nr:hypothetical protein M231_01253 [Tremella mesenterica]